MSKKNIKEVKKAKKVKKARRKTNIFAWMHKNKKSFVSIICVLIVISMLLGTLSSVLLVM